MVSISTPYIVDLFSGAGGTTSGNIEAAIQYINNVVESVKIDKTLKKYKFVAINHWDLAIRTMQRNYPHIQAINSDLEKVDPEDIIKNGYVRLLTASPECTYFSRALGGKPIEKQSRASAKYILKWIHRVYVEDLWIENVPEFTDWGPIHRTCTCGKGIDIQAKLHDRLCHFEKPIKSKKGQFFLHFIKKLREAGYMVEWRVLNAANYGDATTRERLIIIGRKNHPMEWPEPTHSEHGGDMFTGYKRWRTAQEIINWKHKGISIYKKKLSPNTLKRIWKGFIKYGGKTFLLGQQTGSAPRRTTKPVPTIAGAGAIHFVEPFIIQMEHGGSLKSLKKPLNTITSADAFALVEPFLIEYYGTGGAHNTKIPLKTITGNDHFALIEPIIVKVKGKKYKLDFLHRMLSVKELAAAMSFPHDYQFYGGRKEQVKQIGNAVPIELAKSISYTLLKRRNPNGRTIEKRNTGLSQSTVGNSNSGWACAGWGNCYNSRNWYPHLK